MIDGLDKHVHDGYVSAEQYFKRHGPKAYVERYDKRIRAEKHGTVLHDAQQHDRRQH